ncbi:MAG: site-specific integrase [Flavobacteriaceae bacterium]
MNRPHLAFKLRTDRPKKDGTYAIYLYANINGKVSYYSTNKSVKKKDWNKKDQVAKLSAPKWNDINTQLRIYMSKAENYLQQCNINNEIARTDKLDILLRSTAYQTNSYYDFVKHYIKEFKPKYAPRTIIGFETHLNKLKGFNSKLDINSIDVPFWKAFEAHLKEIGNKPNTIHKQSKLLKKFINQAIDFGHINENPLKNLKVKSHEGNREYLTVPEINELQKLYDSNKIAKKGTKNVLRYFLFACYTSLRYQDMKQLKYKNIYNDTLIFDIQKTGKHISIPLSRKAKALIEDSTLKNKLVFKVYTNQVTNRHLKDIMKAAEIIKQISFHCARNTWAMITLELTDNIALVSDVLGHSDLKTTQIYAKIQENAKKTAMDKWDNI